ncbi:MAG: PDDEXK nuclease domain-containing protein [Anaeroplasmataceae bacterium]|nr:PDDEXK nuclease domain-containing protein [Anaeroplasmataceae bacterium]MDE6415303.1 PDDEXK nuclease domain-containing protein [Anaeroplasmataceae bacterium]
MSNTLEKNYVEDLEKIKETIKANQYRAMVVVNSTMILTYYEIGTIINQRKAWGSKYIERLANDLKEYGTGYSARNLKRMARFSRIFKDMKIGPQVAAQIPWITLDEIISKSNSHEEILWYINETHKNGWSRSMVLNQFKLKAYERSLLQPTTSPNIIDNKDSDLTCELFKDTYVFDFIDPNHIKNEMDLKNKMLDHILDVLKELGNGFSLVGKEFEIKVEDNEIYKIDLLLYHTKLHAYVVIEVKIGKFHPKDYGQLVFYVNAIDELEKTEEDNPTIGLLLCKDANRFVAQTTIKNSSISIGISKYKFLEELPEYLNERLKEIK